MTTKKALIYTRTARYWDDDIKEAAIQRQTDELKQAAAKDGYTDVTVIEITTPSGKPQFELLMKAIESGEYAAIYVYDLSRIAREASKLRRVFDTIDKTGTDLKVATLPQLSEATEPMKGIMLDIMAQMTEVRR